MSIPHTYDEPWTVARWRELEWREGEKYEVNEGELVVTGIPEPRHAMAVAELATPVQEFVRRLGIGDIYSVPGSGLSQRVQRLPPRFHCLSSQRHPAGEVGGLWRSALAVEVLSPSTAKYDRGAKRQRYQGAGVGEYWIVDLDARLVERWRPGDARPEVLRDVLTWQPVGAAEPLTLDLRAYFKRVMGD